MKGTSALAMLASMAGVNAFVVPGIVSRASTQSRQMRMSATATSVSNVVDAEGLAVRQAPGDVKLDQGVMDR